MLNVPNVKFVFIVVQCKALMGCRQGHSSYQMVQVPTVRKVQSRFPMLLSESLPGIVFFHLSFYHQVCCDNIFGTRDVVLLCFHVFVLQMLGQ